MTSSKTIINDNPRLTCRINGLTNMSPARIIFDNRLKIKINTKIIKEAKKHHTIIFYNQINKRRIRQLKKLKIKIYKIPLDTEGNLDLKKSLNKAHELGFSRIFLESGIKLITNFLNKNLVDDLKLFVSDRKLGGNGDGSIRKLFGSV